MLVLWYYNESKKNFCPRLSSPIKNIFSDKNETLYFLILEDNSIEVINSTNFLEHASFKFLTNPLADFDNKQNHNYFRTKILAHPSQSI